MKRDKMAAVIREDVARLDTLAKEILVDYNMEDIHSFRIGVKKLRAFLRMVSPAGSRFRLPRRLRRFYLALGGIRMLQLQRDALPKMAMLESKGSIGPIAKQLDQQLIAVRKQADTLLHSGDRPFGRLADRLLDGLPVRLNRGYRHRFLDERLETLRQGSILSAPSDDQLHTIRKTFKDLLYCWTWLGAGERAAIVAAFGGHKELRAAAQLLGDYLDSGLKLAMLEEAGEEPTPIARLRTAWMEEKTSIRREIDLSIGRKLHFAAENAPALSGHRTSAAGLILVTKTSKRVG